MSLKYIKEIAEAYEQGVSIGSICAEFEVYPPEVYRAVRKMGVALRGKAKSRLSGLGGQDRAGVPKQPAESRRKRWPEIYGQDTYERVIMLYREGTPGKRIARDLGIRYNHVLEMLHDASVEVIPGRGSRRYLEIRDEVLRAFRMPGVSLEAICIEFGITMETIYRIVRFEPEVARLRRELKGGRVGRVEVIVEEVLRRLKEEIAAEGGLGMREIVTVQLPLF